MSTLKGRVAIIGGASKGLGKGCALSLAQLGVNIVLCARNQEALDATAGEIRALGVEVLAIAGDMASAADNERVVKETVARFGRIDILVNNSGGPTAGTFRNMKEEDYDRAYQGVLMYVIRMTNLCVPHMEKGGWGRIINITSLSVKEPAETLVLSNVFRAGVVAFAKSIAKDLIKHNITVNNLCPGAFKTDRAKELIQKAAEAAGKTPEQVETENQAKLPLGRYQAPEELGAFAAFLCGDIAGGITGTTIQVDGGISNGLL
ncbi:MAG: SDR family oxidoreductase [Chitinophagaceae bacterium]|nr:MAG: SDR family oxidoreductase [Chitinophagaceae bacterium]